MPTWGRRSSSRRPSGTTCAGSATPGAARSWSRACSPAKTRAGRSRREPGRSSCRTTAGGRVEVLLDGGIRRGGDVVKALCLGARAVLIGRAYAYGLGAGGEAGVARAIEILRTDVVRTLKLLGCSSTKELDSSYVDVP